MCVRIWQRQSKTLLGTPKSGEGYGRICRVPGALGLHVQSLSSRQARASPGLVGPLPLSFPSRGQARPRLPEVQTLAPPAVLERTFSLAPTPTPSWGRVGETASPCRAKALSDPLAPLAALTAGLGPYRHLTAISPSRPHPRVTVGGGRLSPLHFQVSGSRASGAQRHPPAGLGLRRILHPGFCPLIHGESWQPDPVWTPASP